MHKTIEDYLKYLSTSLSVPDPLTLILGKETAVGSNKYLEIKDVGDILNGIELVLGRRGKFNILPPSNFGGRNDMCRPSNDLFSK